MKIAFQLSLTGQREALRDGQMADRYRSIQGADTAELLSRDQSSASDRTAERPPSDQEIQWAIDAHEDPSCIEVDASKPAMFSDDEHVWVPFWVRVPASS